MKKRKQSFVRRRRLPAVLAAVFLLLSLTACGGSGSGGSSKSTAYDSYNAYDSEYPMAEAEYGYDESYYGGAGYAVAQTSARSTANGGSSSDPAMPQKLIRSASVELETTTFDESAAALSDLVDSLGGYFSNASTGDRGGSRKRADYTIRVPADRFNEFLGQVGSICHETWRDVRQDDISEQYYDTAGRLRTQNAKLDRLQKLLEQAENMEDIITIQSAISETEERIEELSGTLSHWDNQVDYATIDLSLSEVYRLSNTPPVPETFFTRLGSAFTSGIRDFADWVGDLLIAFTYSWLWWAVLALAVFGVVKVRRTQWWQKRRAEREARKESRRMIRQTVAYQSGPYQRTASPQNGGQDKTEQQTDETGKQTDATGK